jgi:predicted ArsR family transcriptional regulator
VLIAGTPDTGSQSLESRLESRTRDRVLRAISEHGPITAATLADQLGLTPTAVRRHLDHLAEGCLIEEREQRGGHRGRGRPARSYVLSPAGHHALVSDYDHLAIEALRFLERAGGRDAVSAFVQERVSAVERRYAAELAQVDDTPAARVDALAGALTRDGFAASARPMGGSERPAGSGGSGARDQAPSPLGPLTGIQLCQGHCPVQHAAREFPQFCDAETDAFSRLLGVHVQRLATLAHGDHVCTTFVPAVPTQSTSHSTSHSTVQSTSVHRTPVSTSATITPHPDTTPATATTTKEGSTR